jgi:hypothetical protein
MSEAPPAPPGPGGLQFDRAEPAGAGTPGLACAACKRAIGGDYYTAGPHPVCPECRGAILASLTGGSGFARFAKALILGAVAAAAGAGIYYGVLALTGYQIGFVAIIVGLMVGAAVKKGAEGRGGWRYQLLAMALTYVAIVSTYIPFILEAVRKQPPPAEASKEAPAPAAPQGQEPAPPPGPSAGQPSKELTAGGCLFALVLIAGIALAAPFLAGLENLIGLLIIGFALYEAWALNRKARVELAGPFRAPGANS